MSGGRSAGEVDPADDYADVASDYDAIYAELRSSADVDFYRRLAVAAEGPVLELGTGTGRVLLEIAALGIPATGLDRSPAMLQQLRAKAPPRTLRLVQAAMQSFDLGQDRFCLIFSAFRSFQHLLTVEDQLACLACARRHLAPGGRLAFDVFAPRLDALAAADRPETREVSVEHAGAILTRYVRTRVAHAEQILDLTFRYERSVEGSVVGERVAQLRMRYLFRYELEHLLWRSGFRDVELYGGFDRRPYDYVSGETVVVATAR